MHTKRFSILCSQVASVILFGVMAPLSSQAAQADQKEEFFEKRIRPILVEHCYGCHSAQAKKQKGGLRLDTRAGMLKGGDSGPAVVPDHPDESLLVMAVRYTEESLRMPPKGKLPETAIADFVKWVTIGSPDPRGETKPATAESGGIDLETGREFWSFRPLKRPPAPARLQSAWPRGTIDRFSFAQLDSRSLRPAADADRTTLIRRLYFDLIGLPPSPEEIDNFVNDLARDAIEMVVDRLLASPHFGERWGRHWLDVARFAESSGGGRSMIFKDAWRYRDYVIDAFNTDRPYDQFLTEQLAGDLLPHSDPDTRTRQVVATTFLALGPTNYERQDKDILEMDVIDEQLDTIGRAVLGMTLGCARCHDHKFDPIPTRDYYALAGIFKSTQTLIHDNVSKWLELPLPMDPDLAAKVKDHETAVAALRDQVRLAKDAEKKTGQAVATAGSLAPADLPGIVLDDAQAKRVGEWRPSKFSGNYIGDGYVYDDRSTKSEKTLTFVPDFSHSGRYEVRLAYVPHPNRSEKAPVTVFHADGENTLTINQREAPPIEGRFVSLGQFRFEQGNQWYVMLSNNGANGHVVADAVQFLPEDRSDEKRKAADSAGEPPAPIADSKKLEADLKRLQDAAPPRPMAMSVKEAEKIVDCHICIRGNTHNRGDRVPRGFLQIASRGNPPAPPAAQSGRREFAAWITRPDNPLTARVMANRVWHYLLGSGLVRTVDNFGATGETPSHPELLDHLAASFVENDWSVKKLIREIVLSRTYQLTSAPNAALAAADPDNRLFGRANRRRLDAEAIRDCILSASGQLDRIVGGPTIKSGTVKETTYDFADTRRSVYAPVFRNRLVELFEAFDFADPNVVSGRRRSSTVAPQALFLMNSPFIQDQSRHAARTALAATGVDDEARLVLAYRTTLGRPPSSGERELAIGFLSSTGDGPVENRMTAWTMLYQSLFACVDFRYLD